MNIAEHKRRKKKKYTMDNLPKDIEKEYREYDLENKLCPTCGMTLHKIRTDEKMELVMIPARTKLIIYQIPVYACRRCQKKDKGTIIKAKGPAVLFPKSPASASLVAYLMDMKYSKGVPLYRMEAKYETRRHLISKTYVCKMDDGRNRSIFGEGVRLHA